MTGWMTGAAAGVCLAAALEWTLDFWKPEGVARFKKMAAGMFLRLGGVMLLAAWGWLHDPLAGLAGIAAFALGFIFMTLSRYGRFHKMGDRREAGAV